MKAVKIGRVVLRQQMTKEGALRVARLLMTDGLYERGVQPPGEKHQEVLQNPVHKRSRV